MDMLQRLIWPIVICSVFALSVHLYFGNMFEVSADELARQVAVRDIYYPGEGKHEYMGMVMVPSRCHDLSVRSHDFDPDTTILVFETWEQPYRECPKDLVPQAFEITVFAPENIEIKALLDGSFVPIRIIREEPSAK